MPKITDNRSGEIKFVVGGRNKNKSLESFDSWQDKQIEKKLWEQIKSGKRFVQQEQKMLEHKEHQRPPALGRKKKKKKKK